MENENSTSICVKQPIIFPYFHFKIYRLSSDCFEMDLFLMNITMAITIDEINSKSKVPIIVIIK